MTATHFQPEHADEAAAQRPGSAGDGTGRTPLPPLGSWGTARFVWTQLTSMRTALVLLFALAVAAVPGSLIPQRSVSPVRVSDFIKQHDVLGPVYDWAGLFEVYTSPWFSAIYLLLFVSLIGCIIPRVGVYARALRARPPRTPRNLARLPAYSRADLAVPGDVLDRAATTLRKHRYRVDVREGSIAAERGYLREAGNLVFHTSMLFVLLGFAIANLYGFRGTSTIVVGQGFANNLTQYDDISAGARFSDADLLPFTLTVNRFDAKFETGPVQRGAARLFRAEVGVTDSPGQAPRTEVLEVNKPLNINGVTVHLIGHGYAPKVTVKDAAGNVAFSGPVIFLPQDGQFTSAGAIKAPDARPERLAFEGFFLPTAVTGKSGAPISGFPDAFNPVLYLNGWYGPPKAETGLPENVYSLDTAGLTPMKDTEGAPFRLALKEGATVELPDGKGSITMDGWDRWVKLQIGDSPGVSISLAALALGVFGLCLSLFVRPRRLWVRVADGPGEGGVLEVGGLDRADARAGLSEDVAELVKDLVATAPRLPGAPSDPTVKDAHPHSTTPQEAVR